MFEIVVVVVWKGIHSRSDTNKTGAEGLSFYYRRLLYCPDQMLPVMLLSQHRVSSSKIVRPCAPCGARFMGHAIRTWSAVFSAAPHSQFGEEARPHLCMDEWNRPTLVHKRLSLIQAVPGKLIPIGLALVLGTKTMTLEVFSQYSAFHLWFVHSKAGMPSPARLCKRFHAASTNRRLDLVSLGGSEYLRTHLKDHTRYDQGPEIHGKPRRVSLPVGEAQRARCLNLVLVSGPLEWDAGIQ